MSRHYPKTSPIYFGCIGRAGHFLYNSDGRTIYPRRGEWFPWGLDEIDGPLQPQTEEQVEGLCVLHRRDGWTCIAWWDRSEDSRPNSNSALFVEGYRDFEQMVGELSQHFPQVMLRQNCELKLWLLDVR